MNRSKWISFPLRLAEQVLSGQILHMTKQGAFFPEIGYVAPATASVLLEMVLRHTFAYSLKAIRELNELKSYLLNIDFCEWVLLETASD